MTPTPSDDDYRRLLSLRTGLRRFLRWSERRAQAAGLTPTQHQLLLAVRGHADPRGPTVGDVADHLLLRHHSAVGLIDRAEAAGLVTRRPDADNQSVIRLHLTERARASWRRSASCTSRNSPTSRPRCTRSGRRSSATPTGPASHPAPRRATAPLSGPTLRSTGSRPEGEIIFT